jgi:hypothetical protein
MGSYQRWGGGLLLIKWTILFNRNEMIRQKAASTTKVRIEACVVPWCSCNFLTVSSSTYMSSCRIYLSQRRVIVEEIAFCAKLFFVWIWIFISPLHSALSLSSVIISLSHHHDHTRSSTTKRHVRIWISKRRRIWNGKQWIKARGSTRLLYCGASALIALIRK